MVEASSDVRPAEKSKVRSMAWYVGVLLAAILCVASFGSRNLVLTLTLAALVWILYRYRSVAELSQVYRDRGLSSESFFGGRRTSQKDVRGASSSSLSQ